MSEIIYSQDSFETLAKKGGVQGIEFKKESVTNVIAS